jgi:glycerophosphoryl diester phosphodiesterase
LKRWARPSLAVRPLVLGHRGARHASPENTFAAFELAIREGADGIELDVRLDGDGNPIVLHDRTLARITGWHDVRDVETLGATELARVDAGRGERVPRLDDVLAWAARGGHLVNVELKRDVSSRARLVDGVARALRALPGTDPAEVVLCSSFDPRIVRALSALDLPVGWLVHAGQRVLKEARGSRLLGAVAVHPERVLASATRVARWHRAGALVNVWTVNDPSEARALAALGVDALITDRPGALLAGLA